MVYYSSFVLKIATNRLHRFLLQGYWGRSITWWIPWCPGYGFYGSSSRSDRWVRRSPPLLTHRLVYVFFSFFLYIYYYVMDIGKSYSLSLKCIAVVISWSCSLERRSGCNLFSRAASALLINCFKLSAKWLSFISMWSVHCLIFLEYIMLLQYWYLMVSFHCCCMLAISCDF